MNRPNRGKGRGRAGPSDPQDILRRNAEMRAAARERAKSPDTWGVSGEVLFLPSAVDVQVNQDEAGRIVGAKRRSDPFDLLHGRGSLSDAQHRAADRLYRDWSLRCGVRDHDELATPIDGSGSADGLTQGMIDAGRRVSQALSAVGPVNAKLLQALIEPFAAGEVRPWRAIVQRVTGEIDQNAQGALVRQACEALRLVYDQVDELRRRAKLERQAAADLRPFGDFQPAET